MVVLLSIAAYTWLGYNFFDATGADQFTLCTIKNITGVPCPSCGTTRSVEFILHGNIVEAIMINPLGLLAALLLVVVPFLLMFDLILKRQSFIDFFKKTETALKKQIVYIPLITLGLLNWCWNIIKGL
jgi:hypothetical protein